MGVAPEATVEYLYLAVGSTFISIKEPYIFVLHTILLSEVHIALLIRVAPEHFEQILVFDHRLPKFLYWNSQYFSVAIFE